MNLFYKMELLECNRFFDLTFQLFHAIFWYITYDMIDAFALTIKV